MKIVDLLKIGNTDKNHVDIGQTGKAGIQNRCPSILHTTPKQKS